MVHRDSAVSCFLFNSFHCVKAFPLGFHLTGGIVALGKFDALHIGHRELAIQASEAGAPFLLSFVGMAEVFGWPPR